MGSYGRSGRGAGRCERCFRLEMIWLRRRGNLAPGRLSTITWSFMGDATASMQIFASESGLDLLFTKDRGPVRQIVPFAYTKAGFGERARLQCPGCFRACDCLYMGSRFLCRLCLRLTFLSQYEPAHERARMKAPCYICAS